MKTRFDVGEKLFLIFDKDAEWNIRGPYEVEKIYIDDDGIQYKCNEDVVVVEKEDEEEKFVFNDPTEAFEKFVELWTEEEEEEE